MKQKKQIFLRKHAAPSHIVVASILISLAVLGWAKYSSTTHLNEEDYKSTSKLAYVDPKDAVSQVENFYRQYLNPNTPQDMLPKLIEGYGNKNLVFYSQYYQHGFDPITCSTTWPVKVTARLESTGPVALVNAVAEYPDATKQTIQARVVLSDKLAIDSITCPGDKGNLSPRVQE